MIIRYLSLLLLSLLLLTSASAETVRNWTAYGGENFGEFVTTSPYTSWDAMISAANAQIASVAPGYTCAWTITAPSSGSFSQAAICSKPYSSYKYVGVITQNLTVTCNAPETFDPATGTCLPPCTPPLVRGADGQCKSMCQEVKSLMNGTPQAFGWYAVPVGSGNATGVYCDSGCAVNLAIGDTGYYSDGKINTFNRQKMYTGNSCTSEPALPAPSAPEKSPPTPPKKPACSPLEGVMTSSSGAVHCVPSGIPGSNPPVTSKETSKKTNPDGTTVETTTTTTRDPATGAESKETTSTTRDGSGNVTSTSSETSGKSSNVGSDPSKPEGSDFCVKNPTMQICKGGMNEEETQKKVREAAEKIRDHLDAKDFDAASHFKPLEISADAQAKIDDAIGKINADIAKFGTSADPSKGFYDSFMTQFDNWIGPINNAGCQPFSGRVGPYTWNLDHCPTAAKISEIGAYCMWVMLAFGVFSLATRNRS